MWSQPVSHSSLLKPDLWYTSETISARRSCLCVSERFCFGSIRIDGITYNHDVVIDRGKVRKRKKKPSRKFRHAFGRTLLSTEEKIRWKCGRLVIGTAADALRVMTDVKREATRGAYDYSHKGAER
jgi:hypothetical protein